MSAARVCRCEACGAPVAWREARCAYCRAPQAWVTGAAIERAGELVRWDLRARPLEAWLGHGEARSTQSLPSTPEGVVLRADAGRADRGPVGPSVRDAAVRVEGLCRGEGSYFGALARLQDLGVTEVSYCAQVRPALRAVALYQRVGGAEHAHLLPVAPWRVVPAVLGEGAWNAVELRAADALLQVFVNDVLALSVEDADLTYGRLGWEAGSLGASSSHVVLRAIEAWRV